MIPPRACKAALRAIHRRLNLHGRDASGALPRALRVPSTACRRDVAKAVLSLLRQVSVARAAAVCVLAVARRVAARAQDCRASAALALNRALASGPPVADAAPADFPAARFLLTLRQRAAGASWCAAIPCLAGAAARAQSAPHVARALELALTSWGARGFSDLALGRCSAVDVNRVAARRVDNVSLHTGADKSALVPAPASRDDPSDSSRDGARPKRVPNVCPSAVVHQDANHGNRAAAAGST